ncbi:hypothetical protein CMI47_18855 [Candidatus Pacearchaeota archaeon]|nr:hypothetical protein [Candidatus Pacearchaeota archaeon]
MAIFKEIPGSDIRAGRSFLHQLVDIPQQSISGSVSRKKYKAFITGGKGPGITSSLFQTVHDNNFSLQSANPVFDITVGLYSGSTTVTDAVTSVDYFGKFLFSSQSVMMNEKIDVYRQYSQLLLGSADIQFRSPVTGTLEQDKINEALFISFRRQFTRDEIKPETFAMKFFTTASVVDDNPGFNLSTTSEAGSQIFTDIGSTATQTTLFGGKVGHIVNANNPTNKLVGSLWYQKGIAVLDLSKIMLGSQHVSGVIRAINDNSPAVGSPTGTMVIGSGNPEVKFIPDLMVSASVDDILDHVCMCRFSSGTYTAMTFQNTTNINSTLIFCRVGSDEFNYSSNPTYTDESDTLNVLEGGIENRQQSFTFFTSVGLYDAHDNLLAVAKLSRPVEKNNEKSLALRVRIDF